MLAVPNAAVSGIAAPGIAVPFGATTVDAFLGGRVAAVQPSSRHHRSGLDAILLAAALDGDTAGRVVDLGAGAGVAGFAIAARAAAVEMVLAEREAELAACAVAALGLPANAGFATRVRVVEADILESGSRRAAGLPPQAFDHAIMNPPFHDEASVRRSPRDERARAHVLGEGGLDAWFRAAAALVKPGGTLAVILPAGRLADLLAACSARFGALALLPVHARSGEPAIRVLARGVKGSRGPSRLLPGLILHDAVAMPTDGPAFTSAAAAILRDGAALADVHPAWSEAWRPDRRRETPLPPPAESANP